MALYWPQGLKKRIPSNLGSQFATREANGFQHSSISWGPNNKPKNAQNWPQVFPGPNS
jgi:hypothetical protein